MTNKTKQVQHTPGPWKAVRDTAFWRVVPVEGAGSDGIPFTIGDVCASAPDYPDGGLQEANARLIAAAPDLLEALRNVEWAGTEDHPEGGYYIACPSCGGGHPDNRNTPESHTGHTNECELAAAIARATATVEGVGT